MHPPRLGRQRTAYRIGAGAFTKGWRGSRAWSRLSAAVFLFPPARKRVIAAYRARVTRDRVPPISPGLRPSGSCHADRPTRLLVQSPPRTRESSQWSFARPQGAHAGSKGRRLKLAAVRRNRAAQQCFALPHASSPSTHGGRSVDDDTGGGRDGTLACQGTVTETMMELDAKPKPISMGIIANFTNRTVQGFEDLPLTNQMSAYGPQVRWRSRSKPLPGSRRCEDQIKA
jgi:hypothetical protein